MVSVPGDNVWVIFVHVPEYPGLCRGKPADVVGEYQVMAFDPPDPAEPGDEVSAVNDNLIIPSAMTGWY